MIESPHGNTGQRLARLRKERGISQAALAKLTGLSGQGAIGSIERDTRGYGASVVDIARALGTTLGYLLMESDAAASTLPPFIANTEPNLRGKVPLISWMRTGEWCEAADPFQPGNAERWMECPGTTAAAPLRCACAATQ